MAWTDYWRIVKPKPTKNNYVSHDLYGDDTTGHSAYNNFSWYNQIMRGSGSRTQKYNQYDNMDSDVDVARALDTIAEEMSNLDDNTGLPFEIQYHNDDNKEVDESIVMTVKAALRHWVKIQDFDTRIFTTSRNTIKYGDCFFRKTSDHKRWRYLPPEIIVGIELDQDDNVVAYHLKKTQTDNNKGYMELEVVPAGGIVHFTLSDGMADTAPFGESVLSSVVRSWKQMGLLEDATVIYRVVRAPERRVFYVDVGNMPPHKVKTYLEGVKNEMKQKRIPNTQGGTDKVDSVYNPMSMTEDYIFGSTANGRGSRVETLPGGEQTGEMGDVKYFRDKVFRGLRVPSSYMRTDENSPQGAVFNDGKVGVAYIEELRFANFVKRLQAKEEKTYDVEFKNYLKVSGINIDENLFSIKLPEPQNFALYRQSQLNTELINTFQSADGINYLSKRYILKRFLGFTEDDIQTNESMLRQERGIPDTDEEAPMQDIQMFYDANVFDNLEVEVPQFKNGEFTEEESAGESAEDTTDGLDDEDTVDAADASSDDEDMSSDLGLTSDDEAPEEQ